MRVLMDTNIFIYREDFKVMPENLQKLLRILNMQKVEILVHPKSLEDIKRDPDEKRKKITLSKINTYPELEDPPNPDKDDFFISVVGPPITPNDVVDNAILYAVYKDAVDFLITEDRGIHKKALKLGIKDRVLSIEDAISIFEKDLPVEKVSRPPALKEEQVYNLNVDDPIFDSLKEEYPRFENWFKKISREGRKCWVNFNDDGSIGAILIYKIENEPINSVPPLPAKKRLKICTLIATRTGYKVGELFIKLAVEYAIKNNLEEIYLTHFTKEKDYLVNLITEYGFNKVAYKLTNGRKEDVYLKEVFVAKENLRNLPPVEISKKYWPNFYDGPKVKKFIVPIKPEYHERLFIDFKERQTKLHEHFGEFIIEGNTIKKAYLCHTRTRQISPGDILLFYRSHDRQEITSIGVVEKFFPSLCDENEIIRIVGKRTVYSIDEIRQMVEKPTTVILFTWHFHFSEPLKIDKLKEWRILSMAPQSIVSISHRKYLTIKEKGGIDERFTVN